MSINRGKHGWSGVTVMVAAMLLAATGAAGDGRATAGPGPVLGHFRNHPDSGSWLDTMTEAEQIYGPFAGHWRSYHPPGRLPMDPHVQLGRDEITAAERGKRLHISWRPWASDGNWATPYDDQTLDAVLTGLKQHCGQGCWLSLAPEPELDWGSAGEPIPGFGYADFHSMWRKVAAARARVGADNVELVWIVQGFDEQLHHYDDLWPGNELVDVVGQDPYIRKGTSPEKLGENMVERVGWFRDQSRLDPTTDYAAKPHIIAEYGCDLGGDPDDRGTAEHRAACIKGVQDVLDDVATIDGITVTELSFFDARTNTINDPPEIDGRAYRDLKRATEMR
jgi:hypothetical protein